MLFSSNFALWYSLSHQILFLCGIIILGNSRNIISKTWKLLISQRRGSASGCGKVCSQPVVSLPSARKTLISWKSCRYQFLKKSQNGCVFEKLKLKLKTETHMAIQTNLVVQQLLVCDVSE